MVRAFDLISKMRARPRYQLSADIHSHKAGNKFAFESPLSFVKIKKKINQPFFL